MWFVLYVVSVAIANVVTAAFAPLHVVGLIIPMGTFFIGVTLLLRNMVQMHLGRKQVYGAIVIALVVSAISSHLLGDALTITYASAVSFLVSESMDTEVFSRLRSRNLYIRVLSGGSVGAILDSIIFVVLGLSPIGAGFISWSLVPTAVAGQLVVKVAMQALGGTGVTMISKHRTLSEV